MLIEIQDQEMHVFPILAGMPGQDFIDLLGNYFSALCL